MGVNIMSSTMDMDTSISRCHLLKLIRCLEDDDRIPDETILNSGNLIRRYPTIATLINTAFISSTGNIVSDTLVYFNTLGYKVHTEEGNVGPTMVISIVTKKGLVQFSPY